MKKVCKTCGAELGEGMRVCSICGSVYGEAPSFEETTVLNNEPSFGNDPRLQKPQSAPQNNTQHRQYQNNHIQHNSNVYGRKEAAYTNTDIDMRTGNHASPEFTAKQNSFQYYQPSASSQRDSILGNKNNPPYGYAPAPAKRKSGTRAGLIMGISIAAIALVSVIAVIFLIQNSSDADSGYSNDYSFYEAEEDIVIEHGFITDTNYTNPDMDISFDLPSSYWRFYSNQEIYDIFSEDFTWYEMYFDSLGYACAENMYETIYFDVFAADMVNAAIIFTYYAKTTSFTDDMSADEYIIDSFGLSDNEDIYSYYIAGREYRVYEDISYDDDYITTQSCAVRRTGDYFCVINVINCPEFDSNETTYYMDLFY